MPKGSQSIEINASCADVFELVHDYARRLEWDSMLSQAVLLHGARAAGLGVRSRCTGTWKSGFLALETEYIQFHPGQISAVRLTNRPPFFEHFAATIRHEALDGGRSRTTYLYTFNARPRVLAPLLEPIMQLMMRREIAQRLRALRSFLERKPGSVQ